VVVVQPDPIVREDEDLVVLPAPLGQLHAIGSGGENAVGLGEDQSIPLAGLVGQPRLEVRALPRGEFDRGHVQVLESADYSPTL